MMGHIKKIIHNMSYLIAGELLARAIGAVIIFYLARVLGPIMFGKYTFTLSFMSYFTMLGVFGLDIAGIRALSHYKDRLSVAKNVEFLIFTISFLSTLLMIIVGLNIRGPAVDHKLITLFSGCVLVNGLTLEWFFQGTENMKLVAVARILQRLLYVLLIIMFVRSPDNLYYLPLFLAGAIAFAQGYLWIHFFRYRDSKRLSALDFGLIKEIFLFAVPIGLAGFTITIYRNTDSLMLGLMKTSKEVGFYNAALRFVLLIAMFRHLAMQATFPRLNKLYRSSRQEFKEVLLQIETVMSGIAVPVLFIVAVFSKQIVKLLYGMEYMPAAKVFPYLLISVGILFVSFVFPNTLNIVGRSWGYFKVTFSAAITNVIFNYILIPKFGVVGAAIGTIVAELSILLTSFWLTKEITNFNLVFLFAPTFVGVVVLLFFSFLVSNVYLKCIGGVLVYIILWWIVYGLTKAHRVSK